MASGTLCTEYLFLNLGLFKQDIGLSIVSGSFTDSLLNTGKSFKTIPFKPS